MAGNDCARGLGRWIGMDPEEDAAAAALRVIPTTSVAVHGSGRVARAFFRLADGEKLGRRGRGIAAERRWRRIGFDPYPSGETA